MKDKTPFVYVYIVYYFDVDEESRFERLRQVHPIPCASLHRAAMFVQPKIEVFQLQEINVGALWRHGNYWIQKEPIIDSFNEGLERNSPFTNERVSNLKLE